MKLNNMMMAVIALLSMTNIAANAQEQERSVPKHEFTLIDFGGLSTLQYNMTELDRAGAFGHGRGLGYTRFFNDRWGFTTGVEFTRYKAKSSAALFVTGQYYTEPNNGQTDQYLFAGNFVNFVEHQRTLQLQIPLMAQFMQPLSAAKTHFLYAALGGRFGYVVNDKFVHKADKSPVLYHADWMNLAPDEAWPVYEFIPANEYAQKLSLRKINLMLSAELGFRWRVGGNVALYTGVYVDYGLSNLAPAASERAPFELALDDPAIPYIMESNRAEYYSVLAAHKPDSYHTGDKQYVRNNNRYTEKVNTFAAGLKIKIAFWKKAKKQPPASAPVFTQRIDTVTVTKEVVKVRVDTVVKKVPQIKQVIVDLANPLFDSDNFNLTEASLANLQRMITWLNNNPEMHVEIEGHTDSRASEEYNQELSEKRAKVVYEYMVEHGVDAKRLSCKGYGFNKPVASNDTAEGRRQNRRVELRIK
jgi:outer membrane protein OmpA-like peptidoglycan-associated protein